MLKYKKIKGNKIHSTAIINWNNVVLGEIRGVGKVYKKSFNFLYIIIK